MKQPLLKAAAIVLFIGGIAVFVAYKTGFFSNNEPQTLKETTYETVDTDTSKTTVKADTVQPVESIHKTDAIEIETHSSTDKQRKIVIADSFYLDASISSSKSVIIYEEPIPVVEDTNQLMNVMPSSKSMILIDEEKPDLKK